jgi:hypothetical protein
MDCFVRASRAMRTISRLHADCSFQERRAIQLMGAIRALRHKVLLFLFVARFAGKLTSNAGAGNYILNSPGW